MTLALASETASQGSGPDTQAVYAALDQVVDPELDESVVQLGFVEGIYQDHGELTVRLRLPTFWCAPNFAYLMARDARDVLLRVPHVEAVSIVLSDHAHSDEISEGVSCGQSFEEVFPGEVEGDLNALRAVFHTKAFGMRQEQLVRCLLDAGLTAEEVVALCVEDVLDTSDRSGLVLRLGGRRRLVRGAAPLARMYLERRDRMGISADRLVTEEHGHPIPASGLRDYLERGRRQRISMTFNALMCRGLLETRYGLSKVEER
jgi:metal-sulfur cluster biosynthetic enzyme